MLSWFTPASDNEQQQQLVNAALLQQYRNKRKLRYGSGGFDVAAVTLLESGGGDDCPKVAELQRGLWCGATLADLPSMVLEAKAKADAVSSTCFGGFPHPFSRSGFAQHHRSLQAFASFPPSSASSFSPVSFVELHRSSPAPCVLPSSCSCVVGEDRVRVTVSPMVALECELPLAAGRLSPPADMPVVTSSTPSSPYLPSMPSHGDGDDPGFGLGGSGDGAGDEDSSQHLSGSPDSSSGLHPSSASVVSTASGRTGCKRKLARREDAVCEDEEEERGDSQHWLCQGDVACRGCGQECGSGQSESKRRRLGVSPQLAAAGPDTNALMDVAVVDEMVVVDDRGGVAAAGSGWETVSAGQGQGGVQHVSCVVDNGPLEVVTVTTTTTSTSSAAVPETPDEDLQVVVEDTPDSIIEVDVVGDDDEVVHHPSSSSPFPSYSPSTPSPSLSPLHHPPAEIVMQAEETPLKQPDLQGGNGGSSEEVSSEDGDDDAFLSSDSHHHQRPPRISPFLNTPKQRKEERRRILKLSIHKMRAVEDPEHFLRRSVLINNTMKRLQRELREEKMRSGAGRRSSGGYGGLYRRASSLHYDVLNNSYLPLHDEPFTVGENDRITDDMTDALVTRLEATSSPVTPTPSPSPAPAQHEPDTSSSSEESCQPALAVTSSAECSSTTMTWSTDVSSTISELPSSSSLSSSSQCHPQCSSSSEPASTISSEEPRRSGTEAVVELVSTTSLDDLSSCSSSSSTFSSAPTSSSSSSSCGVLEGVLSVPSVAREAQSAGSSCSSESQREKQLYADIDTVFNNLIHALGDS